jgi:hypothetical protein
LSRPFRVGSKASILPGVGAADVRDVLSLSMDKVCGAPIDLSKTYTNEFVAQPQPWRALKPVSRLASVRTPECVIEVRVDAILSYEDGTNHQTNLGFTNHAIR